LEPWSDVEERRPFFVPPSTGRSILAPGAPMVPLMLRTDVHMGNVGFTARLQGAARASNFSADMSNK
ncbi:MAG: hypothetical protein KAI25_13605, partial [Hyphomicrobiaceae bacterium]|nr:hypothetical protein [Hyphomicrobiaceae bacterium]